MLNVGNNLLGSPWARLGPAAVADGARQHGRGRGERSRGRACRTACPHAPAREAPRRRRPPGSGPAPATRPAATFNSSCRSCSARSPSSRSTSAACSASRRGRRPGPRPDRPGDARSRHVGYGSGTPQPPGGHQGQTFFTSATASSSGDPHDTFEGTTGGRPDDRRRPLEQHGEPRVLAALAVVRRRFPHLDRGDAARAKRRHAQRLGDHRQRLRQHVVTMNRDGSYSDHRRRSGHQAGRRPDPQPRRRRERDLNANNSLTVD